MFTDGPQPGNPVLAAVENCADGILLIDRSGAIRWVNPAFTAVTGHSVFEVIGGNPGLRESGWQPPRSFPEVWQTILAGRPWRGQTRNRRKDGSEYLEEMTITPIRDASGAISHFLAIQREIATRAESDPQDWGGREPLEPGLESGSFVSARAELEDQLRQAQKMEAVGHLAGGAAHDLNNLLTVINGYSDLLLSRKEPPETTQEYLQLIREAGERAATLAGRLLAFSRHQTHQSTILNLNDVVTGMITLLRRLLPANIEFTGKLEPKLGTALADAGLMEQVLMNLVVNARDAMPEGGRLEIQTANLELDAALAAGRGGMPPGGYVLLTVADTGMGMDDSTKAHLFEPLYTTKPAGVGTGLGLCTVYRIVKQSAGWISVHSEKGKGTVVSVYLPSTPGETAPAVSAPRIAPQRGTETILLVEDHGDVLRFASSVLESLGYTSLAASSGKEATDRARNFPGPIDLLIIDLDLPDGHGRDIAERLKTIRPGLAVLYISGYPHNAAAAQGTPDFLAKPFSADALGQRVRETLQRRR
ncbi:MAG: response regulator [Acidobacteriia bacterium]|nr:response regulator [Terriglobia bacterium]